MKNKPSLMVRIGGILSLLILILLVIGVATHRFDFIPESNHYEPAEEAALRWIENQLALQADVDEMLLAELNSGAYTLDQPLVVLDPYEYSPFTALILFASDEPLQVAVHVPGKDDLTAVDFTFDGFNTRHIIPVYGLYAGTENQIVLTVEDQSGQQEEVLVPIETQPLPAEFSNDTILLELAQPEKYQPGFTFFYIANGKSAIDANGDYRWGLQANFEPVWNIDIQGHYLMTMGNYEEEIYFIETNPLGHIYRVLYAPYGAHHDIELYHDTHLMVTGTNYETVDGIYEDFIYEIDMQTGEIVNELDLKTIFSRVRVSPDTIDELDLIDWMHLNAIVAVPGEDSIIISGRHQSLVAKLDWPSGDILWISTPAVGLTPMYKEYWLAPIGEGFEGHYQQHAPFILPDDDNNPDTIDLLLFDNGRGRPLEEGAELYSRMVHYRINEKEMTIEQIREYGKEFGSALYSEGRGDADLLPNGNWIGIFEPWVTLDQVLQDVPDDLYTAVYIEVDANNQLVWMAQIIPNNLDPHYREGRTERAGIYTDSANDLEIGETVINLIP